MTAYNVVNPAALVSGQPEDISQVLANFNAIATVLNGNIDDANIKAAAAIALSKLAGYPADATKVPKGDGTWGLPGLTLLWDSVDAAIALPAASIATPVLSQGFKHLRILSTLLSDQVGPQDVLMTINNDVTNANYLRRLVDGGTAMGVSGAADRICGMIAGRSGSAPTASELLIPNYTAVRAHTYRAFSGYIDATPIAHTYDGFALYSVAAAITQLAFSPNGGLLAVGTRISVYGEA